MSWLRGRLGSAGDPRLLDDDAALLTLEGEVAVTVDQQLAGVHYPAGLDPRRVGSRLLRVNLSDLAAVGAEPLHAFLALAAPADYPRRRFFRGLLAACQEFGVALAGGDLARLDTSAASLTLVGRRPAGGRWVRRSAARPGDRLWTGGTLGLSALGRRLLQRSGLEADDGSPRSPDPGAGGETLRQAAEEALERHLAPRPQLGLGRWLGEQERAAALDVSDGLALDLHRLCRSSGVGAVVERRRLPLDGALEPLAATLDLRPLELALHGGEDYVLLFSLPPEVEPPGHLGCHEIGRIIPEGEVLLQDAGRREPLPPGGWDHLGKGGGGAR